MFASTAYCAYSLWRAMAEHKSRGDVYSSCIISQTERHAKSLMHRTLELYKTLPEEVRRARPLEKQTETLTRVVDGGELVGLHAGGEGPRSDGYIDGLMDELAFQEQAISNWRALLPRTVNVYGVSTPNGPGNLYYDLWHGEIAGAENLTRLSLHYSEHPYRKPGTEIGDEWIRQAKTGMPKVESQAILPAFLSSDVLPVSVALAN